MGHPSGGPLQQGQGKEMGSEAQAAHWALHVSWEFIATVSYWPPAPSPCLSNPSSKPLTLFLKYT